MNSSESTQEMLPCSICSDSFPSKTKLFRHLSESHGIEAASGKKGLKLVLLVGWLSEVVEDNDVWFSDRQANPELIDRTSYYVERNLFKALNKFEKPAAEDNYDRPKGYSRGTGIHQRTALLQSTEPTCHSLCDTFCFQYRSLGEAGKDGFVLKLNEFLPSTIRVLHCYILPGGLGSFHAETDCLQRRYEYIIPLKTIMRQEFVQQPEEMITRKNNHRVTETTKRILTENALMDKTFPLETLEGQRRVAFFRKLKDIFKILANKHKFHNYVTCNTEPMDVIIARKVDRIYHKEIISIGDDHYVVFSISGDTFLRGQIRKILGLSLAIALGFLPMEYLQISFDVDKILEIPSLPGFPLYLSECRYPNIEANQNHAIRLDPRRMMNAVSSATTENASQEVLKKVSNELFEWSGIVQNHIIQQLHVFFPDNWIHSFKAKCSQIYANYLHLNMDMKERNLQELFEKKFDLILELEERENNHKSPSPVNTDSPITITDNSSAAEGPEMNSRSANVEGFVQKMNELKFYRIPAEKDDVPDIYREVLTLLRQADRSKLWPASSTGRQTVIEENTLLENGGRGGSFSVGAFPAPLPAPKGNIYFPGNLKFSLS
jgi:tRNA pseudouridine(38-40) synthase